MLPTPPRPVEYRTPTAWLGVGSLPRVTFTEMSSAASVDSLGSREGEGRILPAPPRPEEYYAAESNKKQHK